MKYIKTVLILFVSIPILLFMIVFFFLRQKKISSPTETINQPKSSSISSAPSSSTQIPTIEVEDNGNLVVSHTRYIDGTYTGVSADATYGNIQVQIAISQGKLTKVVFLEYPRDQSTSYAINQYADPKLGQEAIESQSAAVDIVTSASLSSRAFIQSLQSALTQAKG